MQYPLTLTFKIEETKDSPDDILILMSILMMTLLERQRG